jgi:hypothetical protein
MSTEKRQGVKSERKQRKSVVPVQSSNAEKAEKLGGATIF